MLLAAARPALGWVVGAWVNVYHDDPQKTAQDGMLTNVISRLVAALRPGVGPATLPKHSARQA